MRAAITVIALALVAGCAPRTAVQEPSPTAVATPASAQSEQYLGEPQRPVKAAPYVDIADASIASLAATQPAAPTSLSITSIGLDMRIESVGLAPDSSMEIPESATVAGWYEYGAAPAASQGNTVLAAHVDDARVGLGPFAKLKKLGEGDEVWVADAQGVLHGYTVSAVEQTAKSTVDPALIFARDGDPQLVLVTCGGRWNESTRHYEDNVIVWARPMEVTT